MLEFFIKFHRLDHRFTMSANVPDHRRQISFHGPLDSNVKSKSREWQTFIANITSTPAKSCRDLSTRPEELMTRRF